MGSSDVVTSGATVRRLDRSFRWPGDRKVAVVFNVAFEGWSEGKAPGVGPMGNPLPPGSFDTNALSWGHYGEARGMARLLGVLERTGTRASVMVSGVFGERAPDLVRETAAAGHEIVAHAYAQEVIPATLSVEQDREQIARTTELLERAAGLRPRGWISPRGTPGRATARALVEAGYEWHGDVFDDDRPYLQTFEDGKNLVAIPLTMEINDLPHAMRFGRSPRQFIDAFHDLLEGSLAGEDEAVMIDVTAHAHCYGRPAGAWAFETLAREVAGRNDVWRATRGEMAAAVQPALSAGS